MAAPSGDGRFFFVHVMKTGGMTLVEHLAQKFGRDRIFPSREDLQFMEGGRLDVRHHLDLLYLRGLDPARRDYIRGYAGHFPYAACELIDGPLVTMTILRDPIARTVSALRQYTRNPIWVKAGEPLRPNLRTLEEAYTDPRFFEPLLHNHQTKIFSMTLADGIRTFMDVIDVDRSRLERAKENLTRLDLIGLTEDYESFLELVGAHFGWELPQGVRVNTTPTTDETESVSDALLARIADDNAIDLEFYEYAKDLVRLRRAGRAVGA